MLVGWSEPRLAFVGEVMRSGRTPTVTGLRPRSVDGLAGMIADLRASPDCHLGHNPE